MISAITFATICLRNVVKYASDHQFLGTILRCETFTDFCSNVSMHRQWYCDLTFYFEFTEFMSKIVEMCTKKRPVSEACIHYVCNWTWYIDVLYLAAGAGGDLWPLTSDTSITLHVCVCIRISDTFWHCLRLISTMCENTNLNRVACVCLLSADCFLQHCIHQIW